MYNIYQHHIDCLGVSVDSCVHAAHHVTRSLLKDGASGFKSAAVGGVPFRPRWPCRGPWCSPCPPAGCARRGAPGRSSSCSGTAAARRRSPGSWGWAQSPLPWVLPVSPPLNVPPPRPSPPGPPVRCRLCRRWSSGPHSLLRRTEQNRRERVNGYGVVKMSVWRSWKMSKRQIIKAAVIDSLSTRGQQRQTKTTPLINHHLMSKHSGIGCYSVFTFICFLKF